MNAIVIKSPLGYVKCKKSPSQSKAMVLSAWPATSPADDSVKEGHFYSTGDVFSISDKLQGGVIVALRGDTGNSDLNEWEENSITLSLQQIETFIKALQDAADGLKSQASLLK